MAQKTLTTSYLARLSNARSALPLVEPDSNLDGLALARDDDAAVEVVVLVAQGHLDAARLAVHGAAGHRGHEQTEKKIVKINKVSLFVVTILYSE